MMNTELPIHWVCSDKEYFRKIQFIDGTAVPFASANVIQGMNNAIMDIKANYKATNFSFLMILAGKDKLVDNTAAREFYSKTATPSDKKSIKLFPNSMHEIHKEGKFKGEMYESIYKYVAKTLQQGKFSLNNKTMIFGGLKQFQVGRADNAKKYPYLKQAVFAVAVLYLLIGILI